MINSEVGNEFCEEGGFSTCLEDSDIRQNKEEKKEKMKPVTKHEYLHRDYE